MLKRKEKNIKKQQRFMSDAHNVHTEEINKIALSFEDDRRLIHMVELQLTHMEYQQEHYVNKNYYLKYQESVNS